MSISLVMYLKNEEAGVRRAIESVIDHVDEFVAWVTGGDDRTLEIVQEYSPRLYTLQVPPEAVDFGEMESIICHLAKCDFVLRLDGDETLENAHKLKDLIDSEDYVTWKFPRMRWADLEMTVQQEKEAYPDWQYRLFLNDKLSRFVDALHPHFETPHMIGEVSGMVIHHFVDVLHLSNPKRRAEREELYRLLAKKSGKEPEGSPEAMRLAGHQ